MSKKTKIGVDINPLFIQCILEEIEEAKSKRQRNYLHTLSKALDSLYKYPIKLNSGDEATALNGIGPTLAKKLNQYLNIENPKRKRNDEQDEEEPLKKKKEYIPRYRSGAWAILVALLKLERSENKKEFSKEELVERASEYSDTEFFKTGKSHYTAWSSMKTILDKELIIKQGRPQKYSLSESGKALAKKLVKGENKFNQLTSGQVESDVSSEEETPQDSQIEQEIPNTEKKNDISVELLIISDEEEIIEEKGEIQWEDEFDVFYLNEKEKTVRSKNQSQVEISSHDIMFKVKVFPNGDGVLDESLLRIESSQEKDGSICAWISDSHATENSKDLVSLLKKKKKTPKKTKKPKVIVEESEEEEMVISKVDSDGLFESFVKKSKSFEVVLLVDQRERSRNDRNLIYQKLSKKGIKTEQRNLELGDFLWIVKNELNQEYVLDFIVERKIVDDLGLNFELTFKFHPSLMGGTRNRNLD
jgi:hypothetical protein